MPDALLAYGDAGDLLSVEPGLLATAERELRARHAWWYTAR